MTRGWLQQIAGYSVLADPILDRGSRASRCHLAILQGAVRNDESMTHCEKGVDKQIFPLGMRRKRDVKREIDGSHRLVVRAVRRT